MHSITWNKPAQPEFKLSAMEEKQSSKQNENDGGLCKTSFKLQPRTSQKLDSGQDEPIAQRTASSSFNKVSKHFAIITTPKQINTPTQLRSPMTLFLWH